MSSIPGSIPVTGFIAPTNTSDLYPVTDAIYGLDGLRNVNDYTERDNISLLRRREGMIVGVISDGTYWRLMASTGSNTWNVGSASNWEPFLVGSSASVTYSYATSSTISFTTDSSPFGITVSANILPDSITTSLLSTTGGGATAGYVLSNDGVGNFTWIEVVSSSIRKITKYDKNFIMSFDTIGDGQFSGLTISNTPVDGCYVAVFVNGQEFEVGDGVTSSVTCYFSNDGGSTARTFESPGQVQAGDGLYWNGNYAGTDLYAGWRISLYYIV